MELNLRSMSRSVRWLLVPLSSLLFFPMTDAGTRRSQINVGLKPGVSGREWEERAQFFREPASNSADPVAPAPAEIVARVAAGEGHHGAPPAEAAPAHANAAARADAALERALDFLTGSEPNPHLYLFLDMFHRRFGLGRFLDARARYDELMERSTPDKLPELRALRRMLDPNNAIEPEGRDPCVPTVDRLTCPALYCDRMAAPPSYVEKLHAALAAGRYILTHVGLTMMVARDLECRGFVPADVEAAAIDGMTRLISRDGRITDVELEAATFLTYLGYGDHIPEGFTDEVLAGQRPDGGWALDSAESQQPASWHATCIAAWYLLEFRPASGVRQPMVPRR